MSEAWYPQFVSQFWIASSKWHHKKEETIMTWKTDVLFRFDGGNDCDWSKELHFPITLFPKHPTKKDVLVKALKVLEKARPTHEWITEKDQLIAIGQWDNYNDEWVITHKF